MEPSMESVINRIKVDLGKATKQLVVLSKAQIMNQSSNYDLGYLILMHKACNEALEAITKIRKELDLLIKEQYKR